MQPYITFTKRGLFIILAILFCVVFICCEINAVSNSTLNAKTNSERLLFIEKLGCSVVKKDPESKSVRIPEEFSDVYNKYNDLQQTAGYDLSLYKGCQVIIYTYKILPPKEYSGNCVVNLIVYKDKIIGGDISSTALGGFMLPLKQVD